MKKTPRVAAIHDLTGFGRCSLAVAGPVLSAMGVQCCPMPTAYLSTHPAGFDGYQTWDMTEQLSGTIAHYETLGLRFDGVYTGLLFSLDQAEPQGPRRSGGGRPGNGGPWAALRRLPAGAVPGHG